MRPMETTTGSTLETPGGPGSGCKVRGCCMGIPIGCGSLALLALLLSGVLTAGRTVQRHQDRQDLAGLRAEVAALRDDLSDVQDRQDEQSAVVTVPVEPIEPVEPAARPLDLLAAVPNASGNGGPRR